MMKELIYRVDSLLADRTSRYNNTTATLSFFDCQSVYAVNWGEIATSRG
jgi:hypothetical protein